MTVIESRATGLDHYCIPDVADAPTNISSGGGRELAWSVNLKPPKFRCMARLEPQTGGGYTAYVPDLSGVVSEGETEEEAVANIKEALAEALASYLDGGDGIPWEPSTRPADHGEIDRWISVDI